MTIPTTCPRCDKEFEYNESDKEGNCPHCGAHYDIEFDCGDEWDAILIPVFDDPPPAN